MIKIITIGKKHDSNLAAAIKDYEKRLRAPFDISWNIIPPSHKTGTMARQDESSKILSNLNPNEYVILMDENGQMIDNEQFAEAILNSNTTIIIGGAYGVDERLKRRANHIVSLSKMVFPHQLVRLILIEQIYRSMTIVNGHPYHHS